MTSMINKAGWLVAGVLALLVVAALTGVVSGGPLDPPGPPGPTMKTLQEVEPRTAVSSLSGTGTALHLISAPGSYYLTKDVTGTTGKDGIQIAASDVTLDLNGFTLRGAPGTVSGISTDGFRRNVTIRNGVVRDWGANGIFLDSVNSLIEDIRASNNVSVGIAAGANVTVRDSVAFENALGILAGFDSLVTDVQAFSNTEDGIRAPGPAVITNCLVENNYHSGIDAGTGVQISGCTASNNGRHGIEAAGNSMVTGNNVSLNGWDPVVDGAGILAKGRVRVSENNAAQNEIGFLGTQTDGLYVANSASDNSVDNYDIIPGNTVGPIIQGPADPIGNANPWANFAY